MKNNEITEDLKLGNGELERTYEQEVETDGKERD